MFVLLLLFSCICHLNCQENYEIDDKSTLKILNPSFKDRSTKKLILKNGLSVYLVSDKNIDKSSAALCVMSGSWNDPKKYPGMAHFTEHMLFMGTKAFPGENSFSNFITNHGGSNNAYTKSDRTVYGLSINNDDFISALDRFSHFFIDPLLPIDGMKRELDAVDQEYAKNIEHDGWRKYRVEKETSNPSHPHHAFSIGNSKTLAQIPQEAMRNWIAMNYSASNMHLFVYSPLNLSELEKNVVSQFSKIPKRTILPERIDQAVYSNDQKGKIIYLQPVKDLQMVSLSWELPEAFLKDDTQSAELLAYTLSIGSEKTLLALLKKEHLIENMDVYVDRVGTKAAFFTIDIELTDLGVKKYKKAIEICFNALKTYQSLAFKPYLFDQRKNMRVIEYAYQGRTDSFNFAMTTADRMGDEALATFPNKTYVPCSLNIKKVEALLKLLNPNSCRTFVVCNLEKINKIPIKQEKWLGGKYSIAPLPKDLYYTTALQQITYPEPNPFIPSSLVLKQTPELDRPLQIINSDSSIAYYQPDNFYQVPKVVYLVDIHTPYIETNALSTSMLDLYLRICDNILTPTLISAKDSGLFADLSSQKLAMQLTLTGYSEKADKLLEEVLHVMNTPPSEKEYEIQKKALLKEYQNKDKNLPCKQAVDLAQTILVNDVPPYETRHRALKQISYESFISFHKLLLQKAYIQAIYSGNITEKEARATHAKILKSINPIPFEDRIERKVLKFPNDQGPFMIAKNTECLGNSCFLIVNEGNYSFEKRSSQQILSRALQSDFFDALRTKQKTGYIAQSWDSSIENELFQFFLVQSNSHNPKDLLHRFDLFLEDYTLNLPTKICETRFGDIKKSLINQLKTPPVNLLAHAQVLKQLAFEYDDFEWIEKRLKAVEDLTYAQFQKISLPLLSRFNKKRLAILYSGRTNKEKEFLYEPITSLEIKKIANYMPRESISKQQIPM